MSIHVPALVLWGACSDFTHISAAFSPHEFGQAVLDTYAAALGEVVEPLFKKVMGSNQPLQCDRPGSHVYIGVAPLEYPHRLHATTHRSCRGWFCPLSSSVFIQSMSISYWRYESLPDVVGRRASQPH
eukprot:scaffold64691_cov17-Prasinocladus_malaysianus.AAC.1